MAQQSKQAAVGMTAGRFGTMGGGQTRPALPATASNGVFDRIPQTRPRSRFTAGPEAAPIIVRHGGPGGSHGLNVWPTAPVWMPGEPRHRWIACSPGVANRPALNGRLPANVFAPPRRRSVVAPSPVERCSGLKNSGCAFR